MDCTSSTLLSPLVEAVRPYVMSVLAPGRGKSEPRGLWLYVRDGRPAADRNMARTVALR